MPIEVLCKGMPDIFAEYVNYCRGLAFDETPDYKFLRGLFTGLFAKRNYVHDKVYKWSSQLRTYEKMQRKKKRLSRLSTVIVD